MRTPKDIHVSHEREAGEALLTVVSASPISRAGIGQILGELYPTRAVHALETLGEAVESVRAQAADRVLIFADTNRPDQPFLDYSLFKEARRLYTWIVALSVTRSEYVVSALHRIGVDRVLELSATPDQLRVAIDAASSPESNSERLNRNHTPIRGLLSVMELHVLKGISDGRSLKEIASNCHISAKTVSTYKSRIMVKLAANTNVELTQIGAMVLAVQQNVSTLHGQVSAVAGGGKRAKVPPRR